ncbi:unnamed protein product [Haemonchus placei]|uniref:HTH_48 domain-containing protein n=1 Tax=Haemonchus placei TaxID=6290 RepID=A0A0N4W7D1_HAEPC|nr:unnamed protein product [Haemonchus placei]
MAEERLGKFIKRTFLIAHINEQTTAHLRQNSKAMNQHNSNMKAVKYYTIKKGLPL